MKRECRRMAEEIWACWPEGSPSAEVLRHAESCPACGAELASMNSLLGGKATPPRWSDILPESRWRALAQATRDELEPPRKPLMRLAWAPAFALALAVLAVVWPRRREAPTEIPAEIAQNMEFLEHLDLMEDYDAVKDVSPDQEGAR